MGTVLIAWQLGRGLGHVLQTLPLAVDLIGRGHKVYVACRNLSRAVVYADAGVHLLQAPLSVAPCRPFPFSVSFGQLMGNTGFGKKSELFGLASAWRNLYRLIRPDVIICDHAPAALLAARAVPSLRATIGTGFCCPPDVTPFPVVPFLKEARFDPAQVASDEGKVLQHANWMLGQWKLPRLQRLSQLYGEVDESFLVTFPELDHYGAREGARYWGPMCGYRGKAPEWPAGRTDKRIFAYLKPFPGLEVLLESLGERGDSTLIYGDGIGQTTARRFGSATLNFETERLDISIAARECDLAILNASYGATSSVLLAGKPILQVPLHPEQQITARIVSELGAAKILLPSERDATTIGAALDELVTDGSYARSARDFAHKHADFDPERQRLEMVERVCGLIDGFQAVRRQSNRFVLG